MLIGSTTYLSHSAATFFFLVFLNGYQRINSGITKHETILFILIAFSGGIIFLIRPFTGVLVCFPFVATIFIRSVKQSWSRIGLFGFIGMGVLIGSAFLFINYVLHGSVLGSGYAHYVNYAIKNDLRLSLWNPSPYPVKNFIPAVSSFHGITPIISTFWASFTRLGFDGVMITVTLIYCIAVGTGFKVGVEYLILYLLFVGGYSVWVDLGIDSFGPVHISEAVPLGILFVVTFLYRSNDAINRFLIERKIKTDFGGAAFAFALAICFIMCYLPIRIHNIYLMANNISILYKVVKKKNIHNAVVFCSSPFVRMDTIRHYRFWRDNPSIDLNDDIIWVNDFYSDKKNNELQILFPNRTFYRMRWENKDGRLYFDKF